LVGSGRSVYHELAYALLQGNLSYPTVVFMNEKFEVLTPLAGYYPAAPFLRIATYFGDSIFETMTWKDYEATLENTK
ncbi:MAG: thioredoxin, partial [Flavobacteriaceae bacterium]